MSPRAWIFVFCACCALRYGSLSRVDYSAVLLKTQDVTLRHWISKLVPCFEITFHNFECVSLPR